MRVDEYIIISFKYELNAGAEYVEPFEEVDLFQGQIEEGVHKVPLQDVPVDLVLVLDQFLQVLAVFARRRRSQEEQSFDLLPIHRLLLAPGFAHRLPPVVLLNYGFDHHEEMHLGVRAFLRVVDEHGEVPAVSVQHELVEPRVQAPEPVLGSHRRVLGAVERLRVPGGVVGDPLAVRVPGVRAVRASFRGLAPELETLGADAPAKTPHVFKSQCVFLRQLELGDH